MLRGAYAAATGMIARQKQLDVIGNDIANVNTAGFKSDDLTSVAFDKQMIYNALSDKSVGETAAGVVAGETVTDISAGSLTGTGVSTDLAVSGDGFFAVRGSSGVEYTRQGDFEVDNQGYLALPTGERLLGKNGQPVRVGSSDFTVSASGTVTAGSRTVGTVGLYAASSAAGVTKNADGLFSFTGARAAAGSVEQGYLEDSNVNIVTQMTRLMAASRSYQSCSQAFNVSGETENEALSKVGSLNG